MFRRTPGHQTIAAVTKLVATPGPPMPQRPCESIGNRLRRLRDSALMTQAELSRQSGVPLPTIKDIERGATTRPRNSTIRALAEALDVQPRFLLFGG